ncbi:hypothetical protein ACFX13_037882 [Malus domestica]
MAEIRKLLESVRVDRHASSCFLEAFTLVPATLSGGSRSLNGLHTNATCNRRSPGARPRQVFLTWHQFHQGLLACDVGIGRTCMVQNHNH